MTLIERLDAPGPKRILALDGGGIRGALSAGYLVKIETVLRERHQRPDLVLADYFDLIGGTSTGAIIAAGLALGMGAQEISDKYLELGAAAFKKVLLPLKARFSAGAVREQLQRLFGDMPFGDPALRSALCVVAKRGDTGSTWPFINHPRGRYYARNAPIPLRDVVRASTAAPTYFIPESLDVGGRQGAFVDGGVSMANNPALQLFLVATLKGFPFHWPTGEERLMLASIGTGHWKYERQVKEVTEANLIAAAIEVPEMLMLDASWQNQLLLQYLSRSPTAAVIDREVGDLKGDVLGGVPALHYLRYNTALDADNLRALGLAQLAGRALQMREMSDPDNRQALLEVGSAAAEREVLAPHFPAAFDLPPR